MRLNELFEAEGTDKGQYAAAYEVLLRARRRDIRNVLEVGIGTMRRNAPSSMRGYAASHYRPGGSLRAWRDYFPKAEIVGIDVQPDTQFEEERIRTFLCDSTDAAATERFRRSAGGFDFVVDDGSHEAKDQLATVKNLFPALAPNGVYAIEDVGWQSELFSNPQLVEPFVAGAPYSTAYGTDPQFGPWKLILICQAA